MSLREKHRCEVMQLASQLFANQIGDDLSHWPQHARDRLAQRCVVAALGFNLLANAKYWDETKDWACLEDGKEAKDGQDASE